MPGKPRTSIEEKKEELNWKRKQQTVQGQSDNLNVKNQSGEWHNKSEQKQLKREKQES